MKKKVPVISLSCPATFSAQVAGVDRRFSGVAYAGGIITDHWAGPVGFDLSTMSAKAPLPSLLEHDPEKAIGVIDQTEITDKLSVEGLVFSSIDKNAQSVTTKADAGMPWGLSVSIFPKRVMEIPDGVEYTLNGRVQKGPFRVYLDSAIREVSFCSVAADRDAAAQVFSGQTDEYITAEVETMSETNPLETELAELRAKFAAADARASEAEAGLAAVQAQLTDALSQLRDARIADVKATFSAIGRDYTDESAEPYLSMTSNQFAAWRADIAAINAKVEQLPAGLFSLSKQGEQGEELDYAALSRSVTTKFGGKA